LDEISTIATVIKAGKKSLSIDTELIELVILEIEEITYIYYKWAVTLFSTKKVIGRVDYLLDKGTIVSVREAMDLLEE